MVQASQPIMESRSSEKSLKSDQNHHNFSVLIVENESPTVFNLLIQEEEMLFSYASNINSVQVIPAKITDYQQILEKAKLEKTRAYFFVR